MVKDNGLLVRDWKEDVVNLVQFPRTKLVPSVSPYVLKLETWLRMNKLNYMNISNEFNKMSSKGQIPFIELNGRQFADSNLIIDYLSQYFKFLSIDKNLTKRERAEARALTILIEESLFRFLQYCRCRDFSWLGSENGWALHMPGVKKFVFQNFALKMFQNKIRSYNIAQGFGRFTNEEAEESVKKDLTSISDILAEKPYLFGDRPSTVDATLFGHLCQFYYTPLINEKIKPFIQEQTPNLVEFLNRIKAEYWPDWDLICSQLALNTTDIKISASTPIVNSTITPTTTINEEYPSEYFVAKKQQKATN